MSSLTDIQISPFGKFSLPKSHRLQINISKTFGDNKLMTVTILLNPKILKNINGHLESIQVPIVLCIKELPKYRYQ
jgi:hypothetical protein